MDAFLDVLYFRFIDSNIVGRIQQWNIYVTLILNGQTVKVDIAVL